MDQDTDSLMARAREAGVSAAIGAAWDAPSSAHSARVCGTIPGLAGAVGLHPWYVKSDDDISPLAGYTRNPAIVAIGEIGIEGKPGVGPEREVQARMLAAQCEVAQQTRLPVVLHSRYAPDAVYHTVKPFAGLRGVMHSFSSSIDMARKFLDLGFYFSFSGTITWPLAKKIHAVASYIPRDRLLLETDAPSIAIQTPSRIESVKVEPKHLPIIASRLAELHHIEMPELVLCTDANALALFGERLARIVETH